jgi:hypothetical protein
MIENMQHACIRSIILWMFQNQMLHAMLLGNTSIFRDDSRPAGENTPKNTAPGASLAHGNIKMQECFAGKAPGMSSEKN